MIDSYYIDEDFYSRELEKQGSTALLLRTINVVSNELSFRNPSVFGMRRTSDAFSLKPVEGNDPFTVHNFASGADGTLRSGEVAFRVNEALKGSNPTN